MTAQVPHKVSVQDVSGHVEVVGMSSGTVQEAIALYQSVISKRIHARSALANHVDRIMLDEGIELVSNASQRQVQRSASLRRELIEEHGAENYATLAQLRDSQESSVRAWVSRMRKRNELFTVEVQGHTLIPSVQITSAGEVEPQSAEVLRPLLNAELDCWSVWAWLTSPTGLLSGEVPADVARTNIKRAHKAAQRYADELLRARDNVA